MAKEVNKFILEGEELEFTDSKAREDLSTLDTKVDSNFDLLDGKIDTEAGILDSKIDTQVGILDGKIEDVDDKCDNNYDDLNEKIGTQGVPAGGTTGQMLTKSSNSDYATGWENAPKGIPAGGSSGQILSKSSASDYDVDWVNAPSPGANSAYIAPTLTSLTLTDGMSKGFLFIYNGVLYKTNKLLSIGTTIDLQNDCEEVPTLGDFLTDQINDTISVTLGNVTLSHNIIRNGQCTSLSLLIQNVTMNSFYETMATLPEQYRPKNNIYITILGRDTQYGTATTKYYPAILLIERTGELSLQCNNDFINNVKYISWALQWEV